MKIVLAKAPEMAMATADVILLVLAVLFVSLILMLGNVWAAIVTALSPKYRKAKKKNSFDRSKKPISNRDDEQQAAKDRKELTHHD